MNEPTEKLLPLSVVARLMRVPTRWLKNEVLNGNIPCLRAGQRILLVPSLVEASLIKRAQTKSHGEKHD